MLLMCTSVSIRSLDEQPLSLRFRIRSIHYHDRCILTLREALNFSKAYLAVTALRGLTHFVACPNPSA